MTILFVVLAFLAGLLVGTGGLAVTLPWLMSKLDPTQMSNLAERVRSHR